MHTGFQRISPQLETDLVVTFAGRTMRDRIGASLVGDLDHAFGDQRTRDRRAQQILAFIHGIGTEHRVDIIAHELFGEIIDIDLFHTQCFRFATHRLDFFTLTDIGGKGHYLTLIFILQPFKDD